MSGFLSGTPQYWDTYLPQADDYDSAGGYVDALKAGAEDQTDPYGRYWDPIGQQWRGGRRTEREVALSEFGGAKYQPGSTFDKGPYGPDMRLAGKVAHSPGMARAAYDAYDEFGNPLIDPSILAAIEQNLGIGAYEPPPGEGRVDPNAPSGVNTPDQPPSASPGVTPPPATEAIGGGGREPGRFGSDPRNPQSIGGGNPEPGQFVDPRSTPELLASTVDPRYPDFLMRRPGSYGGKFGPRPVNGFGGY